MYGQGQDSKAEGGEVMASIQDKMRARRDAAIAEVVGRVFKILVIGLGLWLLWRIGND